MKPLAIILAVFISFLAIEPGMHAFVATISAGPAGCCVAACTSSSNCHDTQNQKDDCHGKTCNPFQVCSSCALLVNSVVHYDIPVKPGISSKRIFPYDAVYSSLHTSGCWHPPQFV